MKSKKKFKISAIPITIGGLLVAALEAIIGYITVWFFEPLWKKIIQRWKGKDDSNG